MVGTYDDIAKGREGQYRLRIIDNTKGADGCYPGVELLPTARSSPLPTATGPKPSHPTSSACASTWKNSIGSSRSELLIAPWQSVNGTCASDSVG